MVKQVRGFGAGPGSGAESIKVVGGRGGEM